MMVNGTWYDNITCERCRRRHPPHLTCAQAKSIAEADRAMREAAAPPEPRRLTYTLECPHCGQEFELVAKEDA